MKPPLPASILIVAPAAAQVMPARAELIGQLRTEGGPACDAACVAQQKAPHNQALDVQKAYALEGTAPVLKAATGRIVPVVQNRVEMLKAM